MKNSTKIAFIIVTIALILINMFAISFFSEEDNTLKNGEVKSSGNALIGGEFKLKNQHGEEFTHENLKNKISLIYFGFTHCPMICPTALNNISLVMEDLGEEKAKRFQPIFITTDPERDNEKRMSEYLEAFHPNFIGLTGSESELKKAHKAYKVFAKKVEGETENYDMNHTSIIYVMDENGQYLMHFSHTTEPESIIQMIQNL